MYNHCSLAPLEAFDLDDNDRKKKPREDEDEAKLAEDDTEVHCCV